MVSWCMKFEPRPIYQHEWQSVGLHFYRNVGLFERLHQKLRITTLGALDIRILMQYPLTRLVVLDSSYWTRRTGLVVLDTSYCTRRTGLVVFWTITLVLDHVFQCITYGW